MSQLQNVQPIYLPNLKGGKTVSKKTIVLWIGFLAFVLVALVAYLTIPTIFPITEVKEVTSYSTNPELSIAGRYAEAKAIWQKAEVSLSTLNCQSPGVMLLLHL